MREGRLKLPQYASAEDLERYLGDPEDSSNPFSFARSVDLDERSEYPELAGRLLKEWDFHHYYIPEEHGGKLRSFEELFSLVRMIARRDPAIAYTNVIAVVGSISVWIAGTEEQKRRLARIINNKAHLAAGFTEKEHGNDLLACEVTATKVEDGYLISGEKWPLSHGTYSNALTIFARTDDRGGPCGFSLFLVEKDRIEKSSYNHLAKLKTHGIRCADVSGIRFERCLLPHDSLIGPLGAGLELVLKFSQVTRSILPAISIGAADTALRVVMSFALTRRLYGDTIFAIPHTRQILVDAFLDLLICECLNIAVVRSVQAATETMSLPAAINKYYVPTTIGHMLHNLSVVLGARYYLREGHCSGIFQKILRDNAAISIVHVPHIYNLKTITSQFRDIVNYLEKSRYEQDQMLYANLEAIFSLDKPLPVFDPKRLRISNQGRDVVTQGIELSATLLHRLGQDSALEPELWVTIMSLTSDLLEEVKKQIGVWKELENRYGPELNESAEMYELAKRFCRLHAAACCLHMWIYNRDRLGDFFAKGEWLALSMDKLLRSVKPNRPAVKDSYRENMAQEIRRLYREDRLFSIIPLQLTRTADN